MSSDTSRQLGSRGGAANKLLSISTEQSALRRLSLRDVSPNELIDLIRPVFGSIEMSTGPLLNIHAPSSTRKASFRNDSSQRRGDLRRLTNDTPSERLPLSIPCASAIAASKIGPGPRVIVPAFAVCELAPTSGTNVSSIPAKAALAFTAPQKLYSPSRFFRSVKYPLETQQSSELSGPVILNRARSGAT